MPERTITFLTESDSLAHIEGLAGALVESAPDAPWLPVDCVPISVLLGSREEAKQRAVALVEELLAAEPEIDGVRHLYALKEILIRAAMLHQFSLHLDRWLTSQKVGRCIFRSDSSIATSLRYLQQITSSEYRIDSPPPVPRRPLHRVRDFLRQKGANGIVELPWLTAQRLFPVRARLLQRRSAGPTQPGAWWFYSTFYTFTNIGLAYECALGRQFRFLTELRGTADKPLRQGNRQWDELYRFAEKQDTPGPQEIKSAQSRLREYLEGASVNDARAKLLLIRSAEINDVLSRLVPLSMVQTRVLRRWLDNVDPALIVVGNESWEGSLLQLARAKGVPTVVLQHGIFGDFYQYTEQSGDVILARGEFWKEFLSDRSRARCTVLNCESPKAASQNAQAEDLLFVTSQYSAQLFWHPADLDDILTVATRVAHDAKRRLVIRIHPRDSAEPYKNLFTKICSRLGVAPDVEFSSGAGLDETIRKSAVALLYYSTVFLDCLRIGVPIVSPDWHQFAYKDMIQRHRVFNFASNLKGLEALLRDGLSHRLPVSNSYEQFLAQTKPEQIRMFFEELSSRRAAR